MRKLTDKELALLRLVRRSKGADGWAPVSAPIYPLVHSLPRRLVDLEPKDGGGGRIRLTSEGNGVLDAMVWL